MGLIESGKPFKRGLLVFSERETPSAKGSSAGLEKANNHVVSCLWKEPHIKDHTRVVSGSWGNPQLITSKKMGTSVLHPQGAKSFQQLVNLEEVLNLQMRLWSQTTL